MDGLLAILHCADSFLRQDLMSRLTTCQLAIPLLLPDPIEPHKVTFPVWAMRSIVKEWHTSNGTSKEGQIVSYPFPLVSFLRIGKFKVSKSHTINYIISESGHNFFFQYNCSGGGAKHLLVNGLVEVCWYLPSKRDMIFPDLIAFTNLHGDAQEYTQQVKFLSKVSFMNFVFINEDKRNDEALKVLEILAAAPGGLVLLQTGPSEDDDLWHEWLEPIKQSVQVISLEEKTEADIREEIREEINCKLNEKWTNVESHSSLEKHSDVARLCNILVDEDEEHCQKGKELAVAFERIMNSLRRTHRVESLKQLLPLQGPDLWQQWALTEKEQYRQTQRGMCEVDVYSQHQRKKMERIRREQLTLIQPLNPLMESFLTSLLTHNRKTRHYFLLWIQLFLDNLSREQLSQLHTKYRDKVIELENIQKRKNEAAEKACITQLKALNMQLIGASFGLEHLLRESSQIYEAVAVQKQELVSLKNMHILHLPEVAAELMIKGYPLELMDGDAAHVPISWVSAVLTKVKELLDNPRLFVLSVLGIQSSGMSTLLNTVFGVRFTTSAGRCTRGAFMQLLPIHSNLRQECKCDYFLVVDTEGLRAPELAEQTHKHDNELAMFVIGLANLTIINLSGETVGDMDDILQTTVHALLRMKRVRLIPSCHFVHQDVVAVQAGEKAMMSHLKFKETLDIRTQAAAKEEGVEDKYRYFTDIIDFESEKHVFHFQNLWKGDPPMAPVNPGYSINAQFLKFCLITHAKQACSTDLKVFQQHLQALWQAILHENFVFSFKNTLEVTAYNTLDGAYSNWSWQFKEDMMVWEQKAHNKMKSCEISELKCVYDGCISDLPKYVQENHQRVTEEMKLFFKRSAQHEIIIKWKSEMEITLVNLKRQLEQQAEDRCKFWKTNREALAKVDEMKMTHRGFILDHVKHVASQLEKGKLNVEELEEKFYEQWIECIGEIKYLPMKVNVKGDVQKCLIGFEPLRPSQPLVKKKLQENPLGREKHNLQFIVRDVHVKEKPVYRMKGLVRWGSEHPTEEGQKITNKLLEHQRECLKQIKKQDYNPNLANNLLHKLFNDISKHSTDITFTEEYKVDMALTVCWHATIKFQEMVDTERMKNDPVLYLEREVRGPFLKIFIDEYHQIAREVTAASAVCDLLHYSVKKEVVASLSQRIASGMRGAYAFLHTKPALKAKILLDIGEKLNNHSEHHFEDCVLYLTDVEKSLRSWLERYTIQYCHGGKFAEIAQRVISDLVEIIANLVHRVSMDFSRKADEFKIKEWLTKFHREIQTTGRMHLDLTELHQLGGVHQLKNVSFFTEEVRSGLKRLQCTLEEEFQNMPLKEMHTWEKKPHEHLFEALAGCTEQCPFCKEQCDLTNPNHYPATKHSVAMHRPQCLAGYRKVQSEEMVLSICTITVESDKKFPYKEYDKFYPQWSITADKSIKASLYWKWLVGKFADKIAKEFRMKEREIYSEWTKLHWNAVKKDLKEKYNV